MGFFDFFKKKKRDPEKQLRELLDSYELPSFPSSVMRVMEILRDPEGSMKEVTKLIQLDPGMHVTVLKTVNSAAFGLRRKIGNIEHAVNLLGKARLESIILPIAVKNTMPKIKLSCLDQRNFWRTSAKRACLARAIASILHPATQAECFTAGLLQDMAVPVLINVKDKRYCMTLEMWNMDRDTDLVELERDTFGFDHQSIGALMAEQWKFPRYLRDSILYHHEEEEAKVKVPEAVHAVSYIHYAGVDEEEENQSILDVLMKLLDTRRDRAEEILEGAIKEAEEFAMIFV